MHDWVISKAGAGHPNYSRVDVNDPAWVISLFANADRGPLT